MSRKRRETQKGRDYYRRARPLLACLLLICVMIAGHWTAMPLHRCLAFKQPRRYPFSAHISVFLHGCSIPTNAVIMSCADLSLKRDVVR
ncbi:hypothetical protein F4778DRAFT_301397 [Xylariomycetidae sp. FL2044]|nr:hypothetical protein F4778DRAFT_301397 [Xylariomycetidae sp. FL2044]